MKSKLIFIFLIAFIVILFLKMLIISPTRNDDSGSDSIDLNPDYSLNCPKTSCPACPTPSSCPTCPTPSPIDCSAKNVDTINECGPNVSPLGTCNKIIEDFFAEENEIFDTKYLDSVDVPLPALVIAQYDQKNEKVVPILPFKMYEKILKHKLKEKYNNDTEITLLVGQVAVSSGKFQTPFGTVKPLNIAQIYHSTIIFIETSKYNTYKEGTINQEDIIMTLELWGEKGYLGIASLLYPKITNGMVDINYQSVNKIVVQYPDAFGCKNDGSFWTNYFDKIWFLGNTKIDKVKQLYNTSINFLSQKWGYVGASLLSAPYDETIKYKTPVKYLLGNQCDSFAQGMCVALESIDPSNFKNLVSSINWNEVEAFGEWEVVDTTNPDVQKEIEIYLNKIDGLLNKKPTVENYTPTNISNINSVRQSKFSNYLINQQIGLHIMPLIINFLIDRQLKDAPYIYVASFQNKQFNVYKITLYKPYLRSDWSPYSGILYQQENPYKSFPSINYENL